MAIIIHYYDHPDLNIANAVEAGPLGYKLPGATANTVFPQILELRNATQAVGYVETDKVSWLEPVI
jgi:hypothetical protein